MTSASILSRLAVSTSMRGMVIAHIDNLEFILEGMLPVPSDIDVCRRVLGLSPSQAIWVAALMDGRIHSKDFFRSTSPRVHDETHSNSVNVLMMPVRRKLRLLGITLRNAWGVGWFLVPDDIQRLRSLLSERAVA